MTHDPYLVPALERGLQILMQFNRERPRLTGAQLARHLDLPRASVFRLLQTLEKGGFIERTEDGSSYRLGLSVLKLGFELIASMELAELAQPVLVDLRDTLGYSAQLSVRDGTEVVLIAKAPSTNALHQSLKVGARLPAHATALGRVLLQDLSFEQLQALYSTSASWLQFTSQTPASIDDLFERMKQVRQVGYSISEGGFEANISTIAAPIWDAQQRVCAAISVTIPATSIANTEKPVLIQAIGKAAAALTRNTIGGALRSNL